MMLLTMDRAGEWLVMEDDFTQSWIMHAEAVDRAKAGTKSTDSDDTSFAQVIYKTDEAGAGTVFTPRRLRDICLWERTVVRNGWCQVDERTNHCLKGISP